MIIKNVNKYQLKKCILLTLDEYKKILFKIFGGTNIIVYYDLYGLCVYRSENYDQLSTEELNNKLVKYFDVKQVTSIHIDDCDVTGVWIVYK